MIQLPPWASPAAAAWRLIPLPSVAVVGPVSFPLPPPHVVPFFAPVRVELDFPERFGGVGWRAELVDGPLRGPGARCELCGARYSTSAAADPHPCHEIERAPASSWDPGRPLELEHRPRHARGRPRAPSVLASAPVRESIGRRRCMCCRKPIGAAAAASAIVILLERRGQSVRAFRHRWCRQTKAGAA